jgi:hypothetical protein
LKKPSSEDIVLSRLCTRCPRCGFKQQVINFCPAALPATTAGRRVRNGSGSLCIERAPRARWLFCIEQTHRPQQILF